MRGTQAKRLRAAARMFVSTQPARTGDTMERRESKRIPVQTGQIDLTTGKPGVVHWVKYTLSYYSGTYRNVYRQLKRAYKRGDYTTQRVRTS